eukprot:scaffold283730_cov31-Prasinocladus_malaysianus.AAC.1
MHQSSTTPQIESYVYYEHLHMFTISLSNSVIPPLHATRSCTHNAAGGVVVTSQRLYYLPGCCINLPGGVTKHDMHHPLFHSRMQPCILQLYTICTKSFRRCL